MNSSTPVNDPNSKYGIQTVESAGHSLSFFNYHEFLVADYTSLESPSVNSSATKPQKSLVVTHFPNNYQSNTATSRIVRIARGYGDVSLSYIVPQFLTYTPGKEPAALQDSGNLQFAPTGEFHGQVYGPTSATPLVPLLLAANELAQIVLDINTYLRRAFDPYAWQNLLENTLDLVTGTVWSKTVGQLVENHSSKVLLQLEDYVEKKNTQLKAKNVQIISPRTSGYLSVRIKPISTTPQADQNTNSSLTLSCRRQNIPRTLKK